jgi:Na+-transporting methylmalonyl-CoA/oxaloacetate decarboxylase gamma subunit
MVLVILIILICIGYCIYKKYGRKPEPRDPQRPDPKAGKGEYQPAATADPENPA